MKTKLITFFLFAAVLFTSCGPSSEDYLNANISKWNTAVSDMNELYNSVDRVENVEDFPSIKQRVQSTLESLDTRMDGLKTDGAVLPDDVKEMNVALMDYLKISKEITLVYQDLADNAATMTEEQLDGTYNKLDSLESKADEVSNTVDKAQSAFAKKHGIKLYTIPSKK